MQYSNNARNMLAKGMKTLNDAVAVTIGPKGRNVVVCNKEGQPYIINDGITIANEIQLQNKIHNTGVSLVRQATSQTNTIAGDGTTTATLLAYSIVKQGLINIDSGSNPTMIRNGITKATKFLIDLVSQYAIPIKNLEFIAAVAKISAGNNHEIGQLVANAISKIGKDGIINLEEGRSINTELEISDGFNFQNGFISPYFLSKSKNGSIVQENTYLLLWGDKINSVEKEIIPIFNKFKKLQAPLLIIAKDFSKEVVSTLVVNTMKGNTNIAAIKVPGFGDQGDLFLEDLAIFSGGSVLSSERGVTTQNLGINHLGNIKKAIITKDSTTFINDKNEAAINHRCEMLLKQIQRSDSMYEKQKLQNRLSQLTSNVATIKVGAITEVDMRDKKLRIEDAINATQSAILEGVVPGGGMTLLHLSKDLSRWANKNLSGDELTGANIVVKALELPSKQIINNAGENGSQVIQKLKMLSFNNGYDALEKKIVNMYKLAILDPAKVTRSAIQNASSIANIILSTDCVILN
uniref:chaperonin GroEL n=1 Tax=Erythrolobus coxiae TaxID=362235 RepID=UPI001FCDACE3|nr:chaperonin GroEL [Erythrolobus coxiae]UNJ17683.1 chaperonin GroEL [Erythrolobus coxiae]